MCSAFRFKQFTIKQEKSAMKVGTDGVLLGAWVDCSKSKNILDIGCGTGLITIMLAQRCNANIIGIDINNSAYNEAIENVKNCKWHKQINLVNTSIQEFIIQKKNIKFDLIVSNPPYFSNSHKNNNINKTIARHSDSLTIQDLLFCVSELISTNGNFAIIYPWEQFDSIIEFATYNKLFLKRLLKIKPTPLKPIKRFIAEFSKTENKVIDEDLIIEDKGRHQYSDKYKKITKDYYLAF